jgi:hypothetical protein
MPLICIDVTTVSITVDGPQTIAKTSDTVATSTMNTMKIDGKSILLEADLADWLSGYQTAYDHSSYSGGKAQGDAITSISNLTTKTFSSAQVVKGDTVIKGTLKVTAPATDSKGSKDPVSTINVTIKITDPAQTYSKST